jgi:hypothetical protein
MAQQPLVGQGLLMITITLRHTTISRTLLDEWSARRWDLYLTTHNTYKRHTYTPSGGIRAHNPSKRAAADPRRIPRRHWDRCSLSVGGRTVEKFATYMRCEFVVVFVSCVVIRLSDGHRRWRECGASIFRVDSEDGGIVTTRLYGVRTRKISARTWYFSHNEWETVLIN